MVSRSIDRCPTTAIECQGNCVACRPPQSCGEDRQTRDILSRLRPTSDYDILLDDTAGTCPLPDIQPTRACRFAESSLATRPEETRSNCPGQPIYPFNAKGI